MFAVKNGVSIIHGKGKIVKKLGLLQTKPLYSFTDIIYFLKFLQEIYK